MTLDKFVLENQEQFFRLGLSLEDIESKNLIYFIEHADTLNKSFSIKKLSLDQSIFLLKFVDKNYSYNSPLKQQLIDKIKTEIISFHLTGRQLLILQSDEIIEDILLTSCLDDCKYLIKLLSYANNEFAYEEVRNIVSTTTEVFQLSTILSLDRNKIFKELKSELGFCMKTKKKFRSRFRDEYYSLANKNRNVILEEII